MMIDLEIPLLRTLVAIVETGGLTSAGRKVGRTQPAISNQIARLEARVGRKLFVSGRRRLALTRSGEMLLDYARKLLALNDEALARLAAPGIAGRVTLGAPDLYASYILPEALSAFARSHPNVEIQLRCTRSVHLIQALEAGELDLALVTGQSEFGSGGQMIRREPLEWVAGRTGEVEAAGPLPLAMLPQGSIYRRIALEALDAAGRSWSMRSVCDSIAGLRAAVLGGLAVSVFPHCALADDVRRLGAPDGLPPLPSVDLVMFKRRGGVSTAAERLAEFMAKAIGAG